MRFLEELQMNALPSLQTVLYDGWVIRFADGYSNRANSVNPIYRSERDVNEKIAKCEEMFRRKGLKPVFKITPFVNPENLDEILAAKGYEIMLTTSVQTLDLINYGKPEGISGIKHGDLHIKHGDLDSEWYESYCNFNNMSEDKRVIYRKMLDNLIPESFYTTMFLKDKIIGCGMAVIEKGFLGIFDITVREDQRNKGYGRQLVTALINHGLNYGVKTAYLQVMTNNFPAKHLYEKLGFEEEYKYYYRIKR